MAMNSEELEVLATSVGVGFYGLKDDAIKEKLLYEAYID